MNETNVTFVGNVATDIRSSHSRDGVPITSFRLASTTRRFERGKGWTDVDTIFVTVVCWRGLAEHAASSFSKGEPVIVTGRLRVRQWTAEDGRSGTAVELEAVAAGHDVSRGVTTFTRTAPRPLERPALGADQGRDVAADDATAGTAQGRPTGTPATGRGLVAGVVAPTDPATAGAAAAADTDAVEAAA